MPEPDGVYTVLVAQGPPTCGALRYQCIFTKENFFLLKNYIILSICIIVLV